MVLSFEPSPGKVSKPANKLSVGEIVGLIGSLITILLTLWEAKRYYSKGRPRGDNLWSFVRSDIASAWNVLRRRRGRRDNEMTAADRESVRGLTRTQTGNSVVSGDT